MCLTILKDDEAKVAVDDIVVYKMVMGDKDSLRTPFCRVPIKLGEDYSSSLKCNYNEDRTEVSVGLHSFTKKEDALREARFWNLHHVGVNPHHVVKCTIPAGSKYYTGIFELVHLVHHTRKSGSDAIASDRIIYGTELMD